MTKVDVKLINGVALAFEGDAVYSMYVRRHLIFQGQTKPSQLHHKATRYVSAKAQAMLVSQMLDENLLTEEEEIIYKRGRNASTHTKAKNTDIITYKMSTGFEAVLGYLHMLERHDRLEELIAWCIERVEME
ncbi:Mini-ribonuclease 3 [Streptococcus moroccensis]|uniref:Mini-ribonuclease 3 n=1 Tax=Streptococcus moroccensis TaxID=1451356 RepID=A0ABT9YRR5_9STRE|nr:Mini-ribonuclease 3 [Streptococcus moroccensis]MDQ0222409.1 ribonuclease-3 family protein [Streptococcus moroccensis]